MISVIFIRRLVLSRSAVWPFDKLLLFHSEPALSFVEWVEGTSQNSRTGVLSFVSVQAVLVN
jgi:hypothetical protein